MQPSSAPLSVVLGHARVLDAPVGDPRLRIIVRRGGGRAVGLAAMERLYGPAAEVAVAVEDPSEEGVLSTVLQDTIDRARELGIDSLRFVLERDQQGRASAVRGGRVHDGVLELRTTHP